MEALPSILQQSGVTSTPWVDEDTRQSSIVLACEQPMPATTLGTFHFFACACLMLANRFKMLASGE
jgi:hypothetical protein